LIGVTSAIAIIGVAFAVFKYLKNGTYFSSSMHKRFCYKVLANQYYLPHLWEKVVVKPYYKLSVYCWKKVDMKIIDAIVDGIAKIIYTGGAEGRAIQTGNLSSALKLMVGGVFILLTLILFFGLTK
ncbi:MAG: NADH-quinone oxidoreductase subunit L, partial [Arcobacteraceae bacterium]